MKNTLSFCSLVALSLTSAMHLQSKESPFPSREFNLNATLPETSDLDDILNSSLELPLTALRNAHATQDNTGIIEHCKLLCARCYTQLLYRFYRMQQWYKCKVQSVSVSS